MQKKKTSPTLGDSLVAEAQQFQEQRGQGYRERALKLFPPVCGRCCREFEGKNLRELTVHHRDHNHENNPPDGSNWELLCIYCHDYEHSKLLDARSRGKATASADEKASTTYRPFANLETLLKSKKK